MERLPFYHEIDELYVSLLKLQGLALVLCDSLQASEDAGNQQRSFVADILYHGLQEQLEILGEILDEE